MSDLNGKFVWYELMTTDSGAAQTFYCDVVGWKAQDAGLPGGAYTILSAGDSGVGGLVTLPEEAGWAGARPGWIGYIKVEDVDEAAREVARLGGEIRRPAEDLPGLGRLAVVADPGGAAFVVFKWAGEGVPPDIAPGTPGHVGWHELNAADGPAAFDFYSSTFGWEKADAMDMGEMGLYQLFSLRGTIIGAVMTKPPSVPAPVWLYYFNVDDINAAKTRVEKGGGAIVQGPMEVPGGSWIVQAQDPQGAYFALVAPK